MPTPDWPDPARGAKLRQLIGIARRQLGVTDDAHQARVRRITQGRATSARDCTLGEMESILREYKASGFTPTPAPGGGRRRAPAKPDAASPTGTGAMARGTAAPPPSPPAGEVPGERGGTPATRWQSPAVMLPKIGALLRELNDLSDAGQRKTFTYAVGILRRQKGLPPGVACALELATAEELRGVIAALYRQLQRERAKRPAPPSDIDSATAWLDGAREIS